MATVQDIFDLGTITQETVSNAIDGLSVNKIREALPTDTLRNFFDAETEHLDDDELKQWLVTALKRHQAVTSNSTSNSTGYAYAGRGEFSEITAQNRAVSKVETLEIHKTVFTQGKGEYGVANISLFGRNARNEETELTIRQEYFETISNSDRSVAFEMDENYCPVIPQGKTLFLDFRIERGVRGNTWLSREPSVVSQAPVKATDRRGEAAVMVHKTDYVRSQQLLGATTPKGVERFQTDLEKAIKLADRKSEMDFELEVAKRKAAIEGEVEVDLFASKANARQGIKAMVNGLAKEYIEELGLAAADAVAKAQQFYGL